MQGDNYLEAVITPLVADLLTATRDDRWVQCFNTDHGTFFLKWSKGRHRDEPVKREHFTNGYVRFVVGTLPPDSATTKALQLLAKDGGVRLDGGWESISDLKQQARLKQKALKEKKEAKTTEEVIENIEEGAKW